MMLESHAVHVILLEILVGQLNLTNIHLLTPHFRRFTPVLQLYQLAQCLFGRTPRPTKDGHARACARRDDCRQQYHWIGSQIMAFCDGRLVGIACVGGSNSWFRRNFVDATGCGITAGCLVYLYHQKYTRLA